MCDDPMNYVHHLDDLCHYIRSYISENKNWLKNRRDDNWRDKPQGPHALTRINFNPRKD